MSASHLCSNSLKSYLVDISKTLFRCRPGVPSPTSLAHGLSFNYLFTCCVCTSVPLEMIDRKNLNEHDLHLSKGRTCPCLPKYILAYHIWDSSSLQVLLLNRYRSHVGRTLSQVSKALISVTMTYVLCNVGIWKQFKVKVELDVSMLQ